jgi:DNA-binding Lrp family transcriptional regulator
LITDNEKKIIEQLKINSRFSIKEISKKTQIKPSTVYQTINRLKDKKVIDRFTIKLNDKIIERNFIVFMLINTSKDLEENFLSNDYIDEVFGITGEYDLLIKMKFKDVEEFNNFIISFRQNKTILKTLTMVATTKIKEN